MYYEQIVRAGIAAERIERIADACAKANAGRRARRGGRRLPLAAGLEPVARPRSGAVRPELQG
jgi:hypothetical protein